MERDTNRTVLLPHVRKICFQLLGPAPEHPRHDEIRFAPILYNEEERQEWRQRFSAEKQTQETKEQAAVEKKRQRSRPRKAVEKAENDDPPATANAPAQAGEESHAPNAGQEWRNTGGRVSGPAATAAALALLDAFASVEAQILI